MLKPNIHVGGYGCPNFVEKTFAGGSKTLKFVCFLPQKFSAIQYVENNMNNAIYSEIRTPL